MRGGFGKFARFTWEMLGPAGRILSVAMVGISGLSVAFGQQPPAGNDLTQLLGLAPLYVWIIAILATALGCVLFRTFWTVEQRTAGLQVFFDRHDLKRARGSFRSELDRVERVWMMCPAGSVLHEDHGVIQKIDKLLLSDPDDGSLNPQYAKMIRSEPNGLRYTLLGSAQFASEAGKQVRFARTPFFGLIIANPESKDGWARMELLLPYLDAAFRPSVVVDKREQPDLFGHLLNSFNESWSAARLQPEGTEDDSAKLLGHAGQLTAVPLKLVVKSVTFTRSPSRSQSYPLKLRVWLRNEYGESIVLEKPQWEGPNQGMDVAHPDRIVRFKIDKNALSEVHLDNNKEVEM
jgi:hypothetical protein